jgi:hypothetical protein
VGLILQGFRLVVLRRDAIPPMRGWSQRFGSKVLHRDDWPTAFYASAVGFTALALGCIPYRSAFWIQVGFVDPLAMPYAIAAFSVAAFAVLRLSGVHSNRASAALALLGPI